LAREKLASAMLDVSDGLLQDCGHIASESGVGIVIRQRDIPLAPSLEAKESVLAISSGDDYQLLFTSAPGNREKVRQAAKLAGGVDVSCIGKVVNSLRSEVLLETFQGENLRIGTDIPCAGYQHTWSE
jgi:thiamine-monophosphate kinase